MKNQTQYKQMQTIQIRAFVGGGCQTPMSTAPKQPQRKYSKRKNEPSINFKKKQKVHQKES